jgi:Methyltransferase domain
VSDPPFEFDPYLNDPERWGVSLAQMAHIMLPCLDAAGVKSIAEIGAYAGDLTRVLIVWSILAGARVVAIDPTPQPGLEALAADHSELELIRSTSVEALPRIPLPDAIVIDGDHNYYTVSEELRIIAERAGEGELPLLLFHDVCWPHGRRDNYFNVERIPEHARHPTAADGGLFPGDPGVRPGGLPYPDSAAHEAGPRNGVLTAVEEFASQRDQVRLVVIPAFFGFGIAWDTGRPWSDGIAKIVDPFDRHPVLEHLEANRVEHLARAYARQAELWELQARLARQQKVLQRLLDSSAFAVAERLSHLRATARIAANQSVVSKAEIRAVLRDS